LGLALLVGTNVLLGLLVIASTPRATLLPMQRFIPVMWIGFGMNAVSGILLLLADASTMLVNPVMQLKFLFIVLAVVSARLMMREALRTPERPRLVTGPKVLAVSSLLMWAGAIVAGRLTAYLGS
jgi:hypothetical protein